MHTVRNANMVDAEAMTNLPIDANKQEISEDHAVSKNQTAYRVSDISSHDQMLTPLTMGHNSQSILTNAKENS